MRRIVLDTNVLVAAAYAPQSSSRQIIDAVLAGRLVALVSQPVLNEYNVILPRAVRTPAGGDMLASLLELAVLVQPSAIPQTVTADPADDKFLAAAVGGGAQVVVSNDRHLLNHDPFRTIRILRPAQFIHPMDRH